MRTVAEKIYSVDEYFALEDKSEARHEYYYGEIIEMPGETTVANTIAGNIYIFLRFLLKGRPFKVYNHDIKLMVNRKIYRYPDLVLIHQSGDQKKYVTDPVLIVEVLSESTEQADREKKRLEYFSLLSLHYYLLIHQDEPVVEIYSRNGKSWQFDFYTDLEEVVQLPFLGTGLTLHDIFEGVNFEKKGE